MRLNGLKSLAVACSAVVVAVALSTPASAGDLEVRVDGLRSGAGDVHIALYDNPKSFPRRGKFIRTVQVSAAGRMATWVFKGLKAGKYALAIYHDENNNDKFDKGFLGIPLEDFAFSNNAPVFLGPPSFEAAAVAVDREGSRVTVITVNAPDNIASEVINNDDDDEEESDS